jgi:hypothetical protein
MFEGGNDNKPDYVDYAYEKAHEMLRDVSKAQS